MSDELVTAECTFTLLGVVTDRSGLPYLIVSLKSEEYEDGLFALVVFEPCSVEEVPEDVLDMLGVSSSDASDDSDGEDPLFFGGELPDLTGYEGLAIYSVAQDLSSMNIYLAVGECEEFTSDEEGEAELWVFRAAEDIPPEIGGYMDRFEADIGQASPKEVFEA